MGIFKQWSKVAIQLSTAAVGVYFLEKTIVSYLRTPKDQIMFDNPHLSLQKSEQSKLLEAIQVADGEKSQFEIDAENQKREAMERSAFRQKIYEEDREWREHEKKAFEAVEKLRKRKEEERS